MLYFKIGLAVAVLFCVLAIYNCLRLFVAWVNAVLDKDKEFEFPRYLDSTWNTYKDYREKIRYGPSLKESRVEFVWGYCFGVGIFGFPLASILLWPLSVVLTGIYTLMVYDKVYNKDEEKLKAKTKEKAVLLNEEGKVKETL